MNDDTTFMERRAEHVKKHWWQYGTGAIIVGALISWSVIALCDSAKKHVTSDLDLLHQIPQIQQALATFTNRVTRLERQHR